MGIIECVTVFCHFLKDMTPWVDLSDSAVTVRCRKVL